MNSPFISTDEYQKLSNAIVSGIGPVAVLGAVDSAKIQLTADILTAQHSDGGNQKNWALFIVRDEVSGRRFMKDLQAYSENIWYYPSKDLLFFQADSSGSLLTRQRIEVLKHLVEDASGIVVAPIDGLMDKIVKEEQFSESVLRITPGMVIDLERVTAQLAELGYTRLPEVDAMGGFAVRGGILDVYPFTEGNPVRIEFWDNEIDNLREFDPESQRSLDNLDEVVIYPASDRSRKRKAPEVSLLDYFSASAVFFLDEPDRLWERGELVENEFRESFEARIQQARLHAGLAASMAENGMLDSVPEPGELIYGIQEIMDRLQNGRTVLFSSLGANLNRAEWKTSVRFNTAEVSSYRAGIDYLVKDLEQWQREKNRIVVFSPSRTRATRLAQTLRDLGIRAYCPDEGQKESDEDREAVRVIFGTLNSGYQYPDGKFVLLTEGDMFGNADQVRKKRRQKKYEGRKIAKLTELSVGDYVVHEDHGIGIYRGIDHITTEGIEKDYIKIEYGDGGNLYLPATRLDGIQKYAGADAKAPKLNRLNGNDWSKTKARVKTAVKEMARELVRLYAVRQQNTGYRFNPDTIWQKEFEELFPYEETADQTLAIEAAKADMESHKIMDRLICGDVGFGKTEVALRAAFKAVQDSKQVAYLAPTTILAQQIYNTFTERMKGFPVNVALMCRFRTPQQIKKSIADLKSGRVDVVIGTHRILSKDVEFHDLGLLIIDEEQRFGVVHKERIKQIRKNVDVLTLTATPIPRTLHMSMVGIRDMSVLEEPPIDRVPIQTYVCEYNDELVREAINRELGRSGQVYYVHNRVNNIAEIAAHVQGLCPEAHVSYAHGQMSETELEEIMLRFINGEIDVLVSTTIIETGLDIPNANTMIIQDADRMGLSQLYQLRGRVGRSSRVAYAFMMYRRGKMLTEESEKRLRAIREFAHLGSGIRIAMRDLEIRGAGNVLGQEQHGHMEAVGYDLYCKLLNTAVEVEKGILREESGINAQIECNIDAFIPEKYISNEQMKLDIYKRISLIGSEEDYMDMLDELTDRFGEIPQPCSNLLEIARLRAYANRACCTEVQIEKNGFKILISPKAEIKVEEIPVLVKEHQGRLRFTGGVSPMLVYRRTAHDDHWDTLRMINEVKTILDRMAV